MESKGPARPYGYKQKCIVMCHVKEIQTLLVPFFLLDEETSVAQSTAFKSLERISPSSHLLSLGQTANAEEIRMVFFWPATILTEIDAQSCPGQLVKFCDNNCN